MPSIPMEEREIKLEVEDGRLQVDERLALLPAAEGAAITGGVGVVKAKNKLGTFMGVFVPCILNTFGVIIFERLGWIVGQAGLIETLLMFCLAYFVVSLTVLSVAAIATNGEMKGGGTYYLISRALGPEFGGTIGVVYYLATVTGAAFYLVGFGEAFSSAFPMVPHTRWWVFLINSIALMLLIIICFVGANLYAKSSLVILVTLVLSIAITVASFASRTSVAGAPGFSGLNWDTLKGNINPQYTTTDGKMYSFSLIFSILFPGITGLIAGTNMSGDLKDPGGSLPKGTIMAALFTISIYIVLILLMAGSVARHTLVTEYFIMMDVAYYGNVTVTIGVFCAVLSSALSALIGGARIIQAIARDNIIPFLAPFKQGSKKGDEPYLGVLITWVLCQGVLVAGSINFIAPFITLFFLLSFFFINFACFFLRITGAPNFRPSFKYFHWSTALLGALLSVGVMFWSDPLKSSIAVAIVMLLFFVIHFRAPSNHWGDISQALIYHQVRKYLLRLDTRKAHVKYWRPQVLLLVKNPRSSHKLISFVEGLKKSGLYVLGSVILGEWSQAVVEQINDRQDAFTDFIEKLKIKAFSEVVFASCVRTGFQNLILTAGMGGMKPNLVIMGFHNVGKPERQPIAEDQISRAALKGFPDLASEGHDMDVAEWVNIIRDTILLQKNLVLAKNFQLYNIEKGASHFIDCWLIDKTLSLELSPTESVILLFGDIIMRRVSKSVLRIFTIANAGDNVDAVRKPLIDLLLRYRISAQVIVVTLEEVHCTEQTSTALNSLIRMKSEDSALLFLPLPLPPPQDQTDLYFETLSTLTEGFPPTMMVYGVDAVLTNEL